ncbi:MAG: replication initiator protein [Arizlama microvirus]|nr:MAG: replication initiator protein [Arizlama microvirus]
MTVACGQCMGCRIDRSRAWAIRCVHESQKHIENSFLTLTYAPEHLPYGGTIVKKHFADFMKRLRKSIAPKKISFFHCGEYGEDPLDARFLPRSAINVFGRVLGRPHYHAIIFGHDFKDKLPWKKNENGDHLWTSKTLTDLWGKGHCSIGTVSFQSASYCSGYILKKFNGDLAEQHYKFSLNDGSSFDLTPEYITMSLRPAIGRDWMDKFQSDVYPEDFVVMNGKKMKPPRYYDKRLSFQSELTYIQIKAERTNKRLLNLKRIMECMPRRLKSKSIVTAAKANLYKRDLS